MLSRIQEEEIMMQAQGLLGESIFEWEVLSGGLINHVFRAYLEKNSVIVKYAPPHIASAPNVPLCESRSLFEQQALRDIPTLIPHAHTPHLIAGQRGISIVEDKGALPSLSENFSLSMLHRIGEWLATLHNATVDFPQWRAWNNIAIQQSRRSNQYEALACHEYIPSLLTNRFIEIGDKLCTPGICCIMGDLWPPSILMDTDDFWVIDWEFSHYGRPLQDVAHLCAHLDLQAVQGAVPAPSKRVFLESYLSHAEGRVHEDICGNWACVHYAAEILMRTQGMFAEYKQSAFLIEQAITAGTTLDSVWWMEPIVV